MVQKKRQVKEQSKTTSATKKQVKLEEKASNEQHSNQKIKHEESKSEDSLSIVEGGEGEDQQMNAIFNKYGFKHQVILDMTLPSGEKELIPNYQMQFLDRNY